MSSFVSGIKEKLLTQLENINQIRWLFTSDPLKDFSRKRKLDFKEMIHFLLSMGGKSLGVELLEYFSYDPNVVTKSAFVQRRDKIHPEALEMLFHMFTDTIEPISYYENYRLLAVDGSDLCISFNPEDQTTHFPNGPHAKGFNLLHMNALYDLTNRLYVDALIQPIIICLLLGIKRYDVPVIPKVAPD